MEKEVWIKHKVKQFGSDDTIKIGDYIEWRGTVYQFNGWDFGTYQITTNIETNEQIELPYY